MMLLEQALLLGLDCILQDPLSPPHTWSNWIRQQHCILSEKIVCGWSNQIKWKHVTFLYFFICFVFKWYLSKCQSFKVCLWRLERIWKIDTYVNGFYVHDPFQNSIRHWGKDNWQVFNFQKIIFFHGKKILST